VPNTKGVLDFEVREQQSLELQHINVKLLLRDPESVDLAAAVPVFHSWIQGQIFDELLLDVADYSHVPAGPGVMLIGHAADYAVDNTDGRLGIRYNRKAPFGGSNRDRLQQATRAALKAAVRIKQDLKWSFNGRDVEILINDRLLAPNVPETRKAFELELNAFLSQLFNGEEFHVTYPADPRRLFGVGATASRAFSSQELSANLDSPAGE
jgi:hypothetical protein